MCLVIVEVVVCVPVQVVVFKQVGVVVVTTVMFEFVLLPCWCSGVVFVVVVLLFGNVFCCV